MLFLPKSNYTVLEMKLDYLNTYTKLMLLFASLFMGSLSAQDSLTVELPDSSLLLTDSIVHETNDTLTKNGRTLLIKVKHAEGETNKGTIRIIQDERINILDDVIRAHPYEHEGFRIQIIFGSKTLVNNKRASFESKFSFRTYVDWLPPNFRLRIGNFPTKQLAEKHLAKIKKSFSEAYIVKDKIKTPVIYK